MYIDRIPEDAVLIKDALDYIDKAGNIYGIERRNNSHKDEVFIKTQSIVNGYKYCGISYKNGKHITKRVHRLVAEAFLPNPNSYPIVMHIDNNKKNNRVENLKWGTIKENTQQAIDDKLLVNKKGFEDTQSIPCSCYNSLDNQLIKHFGSVSIASVETGLSKSTILHQLNNPNIVIRKNIYFVFYKEPPRKHDIIIQYDFDTNEEICRYTTIGEASRKTGVSDSTISAQIKIGHKPKWSRSDYYFQKITIF